MYRSNYLIAGISISVIAPSELTDNEAFALYRTKGDAEAARNDELYYEIRMIETAERPELKGKCLFKNELNLVFDQTPLLHCFRIPGMQQICEWDLLLKGNKKELHYHPAAAAYFRGSVGVFNAAGFERVLHHFQKYLFHCSYVAYKEKAILFSAPSGGGKTTHGKLWETYADAEMINGDRAVLEVTETSAICHGLPIAGSSGVFTDRTLPLAVIFALEKADENKAVRLKGKEAVYTVYSQLTVNMWDEAFVGDAFDFAIALAQRVPVYRLYCTISQEAVETAKTEAEKVIG